MEEWELKIKQLHAEHEIDVEERIKIALLTGMLPTDFQDYVFQWTDDKAKFKEVRDKVLTLAMNRASISRPCSNGSGQCTSDTLAGGALQ